MQESAGEICKSSTENKSIQFEKRNPLSEKLQIWAIENVFMQFFWSESEKKVKYSE